MIIKEFQWMCSYCAYYSYCMHVYILVLESILVLGEATGSFMLCAFRTDYFRIDSLQAPFDDPCFRHLIM